VIRFKSSVLAGTILAVLLSAPLRAQSAVDGDPADARFRVGALTLDPRFTVRDVGVDTNVFNEARNPQRDFTATLGPEVASWLQTGRLLVTGTSTIGWTYFQKATRQRSLDFSQSGRADLALVRVTPHLEGGYERTRQRPNDEIDLRVKQRRIRMGGGLMVHPGPRFTVDLVYGQHALDFGDGEFGDLDLEQSLNRTEREASVAGRFALTPLTTFVIEGAHRRDEFEFAVDRDSRSISVLPGLEFKPLALIAGRAAVGFRSFEPEREELPGFRGIIAVVDMSYVAQDRLRVHAAVDRDVDYSFEVDQPYFVATSVRGDVTQALGGDFDVVGRVGWTRMAYQAFDRAGAPADGRLDRARLVGTGVGRRLGTDVRIGFDVNYVTRDSNVEDRRYSGLRAGGSITYGY
jgi:hypothetical protein